MKKSRRRVSAPTQQTKSGTISNSTSPTFRRAREITRTVRALVPEKLPTYIRIQRMLDLAQPRQWARIYQPKPLERLRVKNLTLKVPVNRPGRVIISKRGISVAPVSNYARRVSDLASTASLNSPRPLRSFRKARGPLEENRRRYSEVKIFRKE